MTLQKLPMLTLVVAGLGFMGCGKNDAGRGDAGGNAGGNTGSDACPGKPGVSTLGEVPDEHRAPAIACSPTTAIAPPDAGLAACTTDADCVGDGGPHTFFAYCLHGFCSLDQCLSDSDCTNAVCGCGADHGSPVGSVRNNVCVSGNCRTDADCGSGGYCSPTHGYCGLYESFYCHGPSDTCVKATTDCGSCGYSCVYAPTVGAFTCGSPICAG